MCFLEVFEKLVKRSKDLESTSSPATLIRSMEKIYKEAIEDLGRTSDLTDLLDRHRDSVNKASDAWSDNKAVSRKGIDVSAIREALKSSLSKILSTSTLLGSPIPIRDYHIDLAVVESLEQVKPSEKAPKDKFIRPNLVPLKDLFRQRTLRDGNFSSPRRIFIRGHPGIGKSTLCKQVLDEYGGEEVLGNMFSWVL